MSTTPDLHFAFDVGHSSIGWAVLQAAGNLPPKLLGCGSVIFPADDCLASQRRQFRRQRRHIRATRQRISRIANLLEHLRCDPALTANLALYREAGRTHEITGHRAPWLLAARILRGGPLLNWPELWHVLRWYAHNRGYDGNKAWSRHEQDAAAEKEDTEKVENAFRLYEKYGTRTMAETWCAFCGLDPLGDEPTWHGDKRPKGQNAAFPREDIEREVRAILDKHVGTLPKLDTALIRALLDDWRAVPSESIRLPARFRGGLLFGQLVPRFENRIIARCPIAFEQIYQRVLTETSDEEKARHEADKQSKVPAANCVEFFRYRWAMQVANVLVQTDNAKMPRRLSVEERKNLDARMRVRGALTKTEFSKAVEEITSKVPTNVKQMLLHPDADKALVVDPVQHEVTRKEVAPYFDALPERLQKRIRGQLRRGTTFTLEKIREQLAVLTDPAGFDAILMREIESAEAKRGKKIKPVTREDILQRRIEIDPVSGRAPHSREVMRTVDQFIFSTERHPADKDGPLYPSAAIRAAQLQRAIDEKTNNHLVRHRLKILESLHADILRNYAGENKNRVRNVTIEVNRQVKELSGKSAQEIAQELGRRLGNFKNVVAKLERDLKDTGVRITPGLIRKARIAEDLSWKCPYTGALYDAIQLAHRAVDKDHVIPRSERASDSLDSLVITFPSVNRMKGKRTAVQFVEECAGQPVPGADNLSIKTVSNYLADVEKLDTFKGHRDDQTRKKNRKCMLLLRDYVEKEFTPGDLTKTSQLVRLGSQALERHYQDLDEPPVITALPGFLTGTVRKSWDVLGCLSAANPQILDPTHKPRTKTEIRGITHLHHALDACVLALARYFLPRDGSAMELLAKRRLNAEEQKRARAFFGQAIEITSEGETRLADLPEAIKENIRAVLAKRRVVQQIPAELGGLRAELNAWRVVRVEEDRAWLRQRVRQPDGTRKLSERSERTSKLLGLRPGKLQSLKAALFIAHNFGLALDPEPTIIPFHKVWVRLRELRERNGGKPVRVVRNGMLIRVTQKGKRGDFRGTWRVLATKSTQAFGLCFDLATPDGIGLAKGNVQLASLLAAGLEILDPPLCGIDATPLPA